ncbi:MAG: HD-GYP domain-containing protein [Clostridiales bacterium]|nr:HD-GYP domain-containing protein [Clostridiales bacterium]
MRAIPTKYVKDGSILGENLYTAEGQVLVKSGAKLTTSLIGKIEGNRIYTVYVKDVHSDIEVSRLLEQSFRVKGSMLIKELFSLAENNKSILECHDKLSAYANDVLYELKSFRHHAIEYIDIKNVDAYMYSSALNVALLSSLIAWDLHYNDDMVKQVFLGAIYHDIGIALLPNDVINKSTALTIEEKMMILNHPATGYEFSKGMSFLSAYIKQIILQHHECLDGSGYPLRNKGDEIAQIAQIVGISDVYDAMTSDRPYKRAVAPNEALEFLLGSGGKYDKAVFDAFIGRITPYPRGSIVELSSGKHAVVDEVPKDFPLRPVIRIITPTADGYDYQEIDLKKHHNLVINKISYEMI